ncbi:hypothetical protein DQ04_02831040 [Trypanosoma grayi]|uniref:hypothetical protein n=1 Tax=Trypanosoma grayi TaxID=71804 RepID=UPI0004F4623E|nr:hypothetical protein DQ04_02831040 [Trypanosoma grayi]KEG11235.1 hypothetical protein DQ04_02831040 [Trypanosoma grayi]
MCLKRTAEEFAATQLLQKRYENTLAELMGWQRAVVRVTGASPRHGAAAWDTAGRDPRPLSCNEEQQQQRQPQQQKQGKQPHLASIVVADECTVVEMERRRTFVVDMAYSALSLQERKRIETATAAPPPSASSGSAGSAIDDVGQPAGMDDEELAAAIRMDGVIADVLSGVNTVFLSFGPAGGGKTEVLYGTKAAMLEYELLQQLFRNTRRSASRGRLPSVAASTASLHSNGQTAGLLSLFVHGLFDNLVVQAVAHFNIRCTFVELAMNQTVDLLLQQPGRSTSIGGSSSVLVKMVSAVAGEPSAAPAALQLCGGIGEEVTAVKAETAEEVMRVFFDGLGRLGRWRRAASLRASVSGGDSSNADGGAAVTHRGGVSHAIFSLSVESFNEKGHYRRAMASFVDLCGPPTPAATRASASPAPAAARLATPEEQWVEESLQAVCDAVAATAQVRRVPSSGGGNSSSSSSNNNNDSRGDAARAAVAFNELPSSHTNCMARFLRPIFGGNAKAILVCCVDAAQHSREQVLNSLTYAYFFKRIQHQAVPYDIPPELQRLNLQMNAFLAGGSEDEDGGGSSGSFASEDEGQQEVYRRRA